MYGRLLLAVVLAVVPALSIASPSHAADDAATPAKGQSKKPRVAITISKETTRIVRPLRKDGYVDYIAALNEHYSRGTTPPCSCGKRWVRERFGKTFATATSNYSESRHWRTRETILSESTLMQRAGST